MTTPVKIFATTGTEELAKTATEYLREALADHEPGFNVSLGETRISRFSNENLEVQVDNVRDHVVVVLHTMVPPVNENLVQLLALLDAINNAHPRQTVVVFPYMPYARSDRKNRPRISVMGQRLAEILNKVLGVRRVLLIEPHAPHLKQYFVPTADEVPGVPLLVDHIEKNWLCTGDRSDHVIVFADAGAAKRFEDVPVALHLAQAYVHKVRTDNSEQPTVRGLTGEVKGKHCLVVDDEILTGNTVLKDAALLKEQGAASVRVMCVHGVLADQRLGTEELMDKLCNGAVDEYVVTDTIPVADKAALSNGKLTVISVAPLLGEAIKRLILGESISELHRMDAVSS